MSSEPRAGGIPVIGRLRPLEFLGFAGLALAAGLCAWQIAALWPEVEKGIAPPSGGDAQPALAMFLYPTLFVLASVVLSSCIGFAALLARVRRRLEGRAEAFPWPLDLAALRRLSDGMTAAMIVQLACMLLPLFAGRMSAAAAAALFFVIIGSGLAFLVCLGTLAARLGRSWMLWVGLTILTPFGPFIAYFMMRRLLSAARKRSSRGADR